MMVLALRLPLLASIVLHANAQTSSPQTLAAVAFINQGETTPRSVSSAGRLTPTGARQLLQLGTAFRNRYLLNGTSNGTDVAPMQSMPVAFLDNSRLNIMTGTDASLVAGATAFMQGLYPPTASNGGNSSADYPLNGYQYANILTYTASDGNSAVVQGDAACTAWRNEMSQALSNRLDIVNDVSKSQSFYDELILAGPLQGLVSAADSTYLKAMEVYKTAKFYYDNVETARDSLSNDTMATLAANAFSLELAKTSYNGTDPDSSLRALYAVAGGTMAGKVADLFSSYAHTGGSNSGGLTLIFGSSRPMMSFFSAAGLLDQQHPADPFSQLPNPGSAIVFELMGNASASSDAQDFQVRFSYRPGADEADSFAPYALFGSGLGVSTMSLDTFLRGMDNISESVSDWCSLCQPGPSATFCPRPLSYAKDSGSTTSSSPSISRPVAGVVGAIIMLVAIACVTAALMALGGWRFARKTKTGSESSAGGFRGGARMAGDADVVVSKSGHREERVGSWELHNGGKEVSIFPPGAGIVTSEFAQRTKRMDDEDAMSIAGAPVDPRENV